MTFRACVLMSVSEQKVEFSSVAMDNAFLCSHYLIQETNANLELSQINRFLERTVA